MDRRSIFTKTGKGLNEASGKTSALSRELRNLLKEIDGKANAGQLQEKLEKVPEARLLENLAQLTREGYVRELAAAPRVATPAATARGPAMDEGEDLDFTSAMSAPRAAAGVPDLAAKAAADAALKAEAAARAKAEAAARARAEAALRARLEAEDKAKAETAARVAAEAKAQAEARARAETAARAKAEAEARLRAEIAAKAKADAEKAQAEARMRAEADAKARVEAEAKAHAAAEAAARAEADAKARIDAAEKAMAEAQARAQAEAEARTRMEAELHARYEAEARARVEAEARARQEAQAREIEQKARQEAEERARNEALERARQEAEARAERETAERLRREEAERARREADDRAKREAEDRARREAEDRARREAEDRATREAEDRAMRDAEEKARREAAEQARREAEAKQAEERARREEAERIQREAEARARQEVEARERREAEERIRREAEERVRKEFEERARRDSEERAKREGEERARREEEERARREEEERARREEEERRLEAEAELRRDEEQRRRDEEQRLRDEEQRRQAEQETLAARQIATSSRDEAKRKARADAEAAALARKEARTREKAEEEARKRARGEERRLPDEQHYAEADEGRPMPSLRRRRRSLGRPIALGLFVVLLIVLAAIHFMPLDVIPYEKAASERFSQPVKIGTMHMSLFPSPRLRFERVLMGAEPALQIAAVQAVPELGTLFDERKVFKSVDVEGATVPVGFLAGLLWGKAQGDKLRIDRVTGRAVKIDSPGGVLPPLDFNALFTAAGGLKTLSLSNEEKKLSATLQPDADKAVIELTAAEVPFLPGAPLGDFTGKGVLRATELVLNEFELRAFEGYLQGNARLRWANGWTLEGEVAARQVDVAKLAGPLLSSGRLEGKGTYAMRAESLEKLAASARLEGAFSVVKGTIGGVDMTQFLQGSSSPGGLTPFSELSGTLSADARRMQFRQLRLAAGLLNGSGSVDIDAERALSGRMQVELRSQARAALSLTGTLKDPQFRRN